MLDQAGMTTAVRPTRLSDRVAVAMGVPAARHGVTPYVDGLRGVAVLGIFLLHCWNYAGSPPIPFFGGNAGWVPFSLDWGVDLFFILSGFLLAQPWFRAEFGVGPQPSLSNYWRRRLRRILPAYYVSVIVTLAIFSYFGPIRQGSIEGSTGLWNLGGLALLMHGYIPVSASMLSGANGPWWTLTVEFTWYALLPLCVWAFTRRRWVVALPAAAAISIGWAYLANHAFDGFVGDAVASMDWRTSWELQLAWSEDTVRNLLRFSVPGYAFTFAVGVALARLTVIDSLRAPGDVDRWWQRQSVATLAAVSGAIILVVSMYHEGTQRLALRAYFLTAPGPLLIRATALGLIIFALVVGPRGFRRPLESLPLRYLGWVSFSAYLFHVPILILLRQHAGVASFPALLVLGLGLTLGVATASWMFIERPFLAPPETGPRWDQPRKVAAAIAVTAVLSYVWAVHQDDRPTAWSPITEAYAAQSPTGLGPAVNPLPKVVPRPALSGPMSVREAEAKGLVTAPTAAALTSCGAPVDGSIVVMEATLWQSIVTAYPCRDHRAANAAAATLRTADRSTGATSLRDSGVTAFHIPQPAPNPAFPNVRHAAWVDGSVVTQAVIYSKPQPDTWRGALRLIVHAAGYPPG